MCAYSALISVPACVISIGIIILITICICIWIIYTKIPGRRIFRCNHFICM